MSCQPRGHQPSRWSPPGDTCELGSAARRGEMLVGKCWELDTGTEQPRVRVGQGQRQDG